MHVLQKWGIVMQQLNLPFEQPSPNKFNSHPSVADALLEDITSATVSPPATTEEAIYQDIAKLTIALCAYHYKETDVNVVLQHLYADIEHRRQIGLAKYGVELKPHNGRNTKMDLYEEVLDAAFYSKCSAMEVASEAYA